MYLNIAKSQLLRGKLIKNLSDNLSNIIKLDFKKKMFLPLYCSSVQAGFPSPADDYLEESLNLTEKLIKHPTATFLVRVKGDSMVNAGIKQGDMLIVDRSIKPKSDDIVIAIVNGEFTVKRLKLKDSKVYLLPENNRYPYIKIEESDDTYIWGVVTSCIHEF